MRIKKKVVPQRYVASATRETLISKTALASLNVVTARVDPARVTGATPKTLWIKLSMKLKSRRGNSAKTQ